MSETQKDCVVGLIQPQGNKKTTEECLYIPMVTFSLEETSKVVFKENKDFYIVTIFFFFSDGISTVIV